MDDNLESVGSKTAMVGNLPLSEYLEMRETIVNLVETTKTHKEFVKEFRLSLLHIINAAKKVGIDMTSMYDYYENLDFKPVEGFELIGPSGTSAEEGKLILVIKYPKEEDKTLNDLRK